MRNPSNEVNANRLPPGGKGVACVEKWRQGPGQGILPTYIIPERPSLPHFWTAVFSVASACASPLTILWTVKYVNTHPSKSYTAYATFLPTQVGTLGLSFRGSFYTVTFTATEAEQSTFYKANDMKGSLGSRI